MHAKGSAILRNAAHSQHHHHHLYRRSVHHLLPLSISTTCSSPDPSTHRSIMKFRSSTLSLLALSVPATTAWAPLAQAHIRPALFGARGTTALFSAVVSYSTEQIGEASTESFRLQFKGEEGAISPWHDIPLEGDSGYNMVVEIPKMTKVCTHPCCDDVLFSFAGIPKFHSLMFRTCS